MDAMPVLPQLSRSSSSDDTKLPLPRQLKKFYLGEPFALGITQILTGIIGIAFGIVLNITDTYRTEFLVLKTPFWTGILYIISGSVSVAAARNPKMSLVKVMLGMNVVSAVAAGIEIIFLCIPLSFSFRRWHIIYECEQHELKEHNEQCIANEVITDVVVVYQNMTPNNATSQTTDFKDPEAL